MVKVWDDTMKRLVSANPQHFVSWVLKGAQYKGPLPTELKNKTREADLLLEAVLEGEAISMHFEFQSTGDEDMASRTLEYNVDATLEHKRRVLSCVIYLREDNNIVEAPLEWRLPNGRILLWFEFVVIKLWEIAAQELVSTGLVGLLPLVPLTKDGTQREVVETMIDEIVAAKQPELLPLGAVFAGLVFKDSVDREWLRRSFAMHKDILEESWVYQEFVQRGRDEGRQEAQKEAQKALQEELQKERQALLTLVQGRFPEMTELIKIQISNVTSIDILRDSLVKVGLAQNIQEALQILLVLGKAEDKK